ncbi:MAG: hypothetical protein ACM3IH_20600 [Sphingobacteriales bacterium]|jgi:hypothetical protein
MNDIPFWRDHSAPIKSPVKATMTIAIADAVLIEAAIFLSVGAIVGFIFCANFVRKRSVDIGM